MTCHYRKENYCTLKGKSAIPNFPDTHQFCETDCFGMQELRQRAEQAENALANRNSLLFADIDNLQRELKKAEEQRDEAVKTLLQCRTAMLEAERDFHGKSVLFSASFLNQVAALERALLPDEDWREDYANAIPVKWDKEKP